MRALLLCLMLVLGAELRAAEPATAAEVIEAARAAQRLDSSIQRVRMTLVSRGGGERVRELELRVRRSGEVVQSYTRFLSPADVAGTQLVVVDHPDRADEQLLYLPALKRVTRISGNARSGSFAGSDLSFEDLEVSDAGGATHTLVSSDGSGWVIDTVPGAGSSYGRVRTHVARADRLPRKVEYFDRAGAPVKTLEVTETQVVSGAVLPKKTEIRNLVKGTTTRLELLEARVNVPASELPDEVFTAAYLERQGG